MNLEELIEAMRAAARLDNADAILDRLREPSLRFAESEACRDPRFARADPQLGFGLHTLHEEPDHTLSIVLASLLPGRTLPPHDHGTWAIAVGVTGTETNVFWRRDDDGSQPDGARISEIRRERYGPGSFLGMTPLDIHSVVNETTETTVSLNLYGIGLGHAGAVVFDPVAHRVSTMVPPPDTPL
jgi:predicted metal-dependent enzyme (double-stranded beta helix superfamily)